MTYGMSGLAYFDQFVYGTALDRTQIEFQRLFPHFTTNSTDSVISASAALQTLKTRQLRTPQLCYTLMCEEFVSRLQKMGMLDTELESEESNIFAQPILSASYLSELYDLAYDKHSERKLSSKSVKVIVHRALELHQQHQLISLPTEIAEREQLFLCSFEETVCQLFSNLHSHV